MEQSCCQENQLPLMGQDLVYLDPLEGGHVMDYDEAMN